MTPTLDRDRLVRDLRAAAEATEANWYSVAPNTWRELRGMRRAWRVLLAAVTDGEYDQEDP